MAETLQKVAGADGTTVAYRQYGEGPRLITCLHSLALDGSWYAPLAEALDEDYRLLVPDFRGHGQSAHGASDLTLGLIAQDVVAMWDAENIKSSVVLGISLGGMVAQAVTGSFPDRVDAQILMATRGGYDEAAAQGTRARAAEVRAPGGLEAAVDTTMRRWFGAGSQDAANPLVRQARAQFLGAGGNTIAEYFEAMTQVGDFNADSPPPTLVIAGDDDQSTPRAVIEQLAASIRDAELRIAPGGHLLAFENPHQVAAALRPFLENLACWPR
ncbi:alpha/beta fold hydrolase [Arthrobacter sp. MMS18-M83]|uniref:alpha/beta fold hydrolase n=1 Tax=Arthrobacter sp. MMS18-M83 TaxID=2996261 RepID=UPI00227AF947|nr:alpha/beta fold hydrolase [Arthrobacter sp. MMS18-M83]WAH97362.1 alpha/beta fold hydrolase [Arthrobacter sp. MMS18-M83]